ncbi:MAG: c-type cytochrome [Acidobacteriota bacterium]
MRFAFLLVLASALGAQTDGAAIYKQRCAMCHGADGSGSTGMGKTLKLRDLRSAEVQGMTDAQLTEIVSKGKGKMPAYGSTLGAEGVKSVVGYVRSLAKK